MKPPVKPQLNRALLLLVLIAASIAGLHMTVSADSDPKNTKSYQQQLQSEVESDNGAPRDGRNPASQTQTSLAYAASQPAGPGQQVEKPAAAVVGDHNHKVDPKEVLPDTKNSGVLSGGCLLVYGVPGVQCVQVGKVLQTAGNTVTGLSVKPALSCDPSQTLALQGVQLNSVDASGRVAVPGKVACNISNL